MKRKGINHYSNTLPMIILLICWKLAYSIVEGYRNERFQEGNKMVQWIQSQVYILETVYQFIAYLYHLCNECREEGEREKERVSHMLFY